MGSLTSVFTKIKSIMIILTGFLLMLSIFASQVTTTKASKNHLRLVDKGTILSIRESCKDYPDGTPCTKRCIDITCDSKMSRCWKGHCKRSNNHPCEVKSWEMFIHPCCCGDCDNPKKNPLDKNECPNNLK